MKFVIVTTQNEIKFVGLRIKIFNPFRTIKKDTEGVKYQ